MAKKLKNVALKQKKTESEVRRIILDKYFKKVDLKKLKRESCRKNFVLGMKTLPRTIRKDQDIRLCMIPEKAGKSISELVIKAVLYFEP